MANAQNQSVTHSETDGGRQTGLHDLEPPAIGAAALASKEATSEKGASKKSALMKAGAEVPLGTPDAEAHNTEAKRVELYASRKKVYPRRVYGTFRMVKWVVMALSLGIYYLTPWLRIDRGAGAPDQAVLIDMPARKAYFFWIEIWAQEVYYATGLLVLAAMILFLVTALAGRVWCGYACPQTVWTDLFVHIERWIQGDRAARIRLDKAPWGPVKIFKKVSTHAAWLAVAILTGGAMVFYFADAPTLAVQLVTGQAPATSYFFIGLLTFTTYLLGGIAREQVCIYMCPWPRIQSALIDDHSLLVTYNRERGEQRGKYRKGDSWDDRGDCIDCNQCVAVCPTGIDIRDGFQLECIQCGLCADACNGIMKKVGRPQNLIGYAPTHVDRAGGKVTQETGLLSQLLRPRVLIYMGVILVVSALMLTSLVTRSDTTLNVLKDRNPLFVTLSDGTIRDGYTVNIANKQHVVRPVTVTVTGLPGLRLKTATGLPTEAVTIDLPPDALASVRLFALLPGDAVRGGALTSGQGTITFEVHDDTGALIATKDTSFSGPRR